MSAFKFPVHLKHTGLSCVGKRNLLTIGHSKVSGHSEGEITQRAGQQPHQPVPTLPNPSKVSRAAPLHRPENAVPTATSCTALALGPGSQSPQQRNMLEEALTQREKYDLWQCTQLSPTFADLLPICCSWVCWHTMGNQGLLCSLLWPKHPGAGAQTVSSVCQLTAKAEKLVT